LGRRRPNARQATPWSAFSISTETVCAASFELGGGVCRFSTYPLTAWKPLEAKVQGPFPGFRSAFSLKGGCSGFLNTPYRAEHHQPPFRDAPPSNPTETVCSPLIEK
jgi:hypothetical protein